MNTLRHPWRRRAKRVTTVIIGAGHNGLAMSRALSRRAVDHVVLERGDIGNAWRSERWDSLRLLTPNWQSRLPGYGYRGDDPFGYMSRTDTIDFITGYADVIAAPVKTHTRVLAVRASGNGYLVTTNRGEWRCRTLVIASGAFSIPALPSCSAAIPETVEQVTTNHYRNPQQLKDGGVLVVGASATGLQLAQEIHLSGRPVTLAVGEHVRLPRLYRGLDILWWMNETGILDEHYHNVDDLRRVRRVPSPQLVGNSSRNSLDLNSLSSLGIKLVGKLSGVHNHTAQFSGSLNNVCKLADLKMNRLLDRLDRWAEENGWHSAVDGPERFAPTAVDRSPTLNLNLTSGEVKTVVWATGFRPDYHWLKLPVFDRKGALCHDGGIVSAPGVYVLGLPFMRRRKSTYIHGAEDDVRDLSEHLLAGLAQRQLGKSAVV